MPILTLLFNRRTSVAILSAILTLISSPSPTSAFVPPHIITHPSSSTALQHNHHGSGPKQPEIILTPEEQQKLKSEFTTLLHAVIADDQPPEELPSLLSSNIEVILSAMSSKGLIEQVIQDDIQSSTSDNTQQQQRLEELSTGVNLILNFIETFVQQAQSIDTIYKELLRKIFQTISPSPSESTTTTNYGEEALEELLSNESEAFTPGFLRHVEGECMRIASLPETTAESIQMLEILRVIQARILEELGKDIGEGAVVLGQLLGYENKAERLAVLDAGLAVRGIEFANELKGLTEEALGSFASGVEGGVDPELVRIVEEIDGRIEEFVGRSSKAFQ